MSVTWFGQVNGIKSPFFIFPKEGVGYIINLVTKASPDESKTVKYTVWYIGNTTFVSSVTSAWHYPYSFSSTENVARVRFKGGRFISRFRFLYFVNNLSIVSSSNETLRFIADILISSILFETCRDRDAVYQSISWWTRPRFIRSIEYSISVPSAACVRSDKNLKNSSNTRLHYKLFIADHYFPRPVRASDAGGIGIINGT